MDTIKVEWRHEGGEIKGRILEDAAGRRKIVFVGRDHRGRRPKHGEITEARVSKDTKPDDKHKGALLVTPVYPRDPAAVSETEARAKMLELIVKQGKRFWPEELQIDLPGWRGTLEPRRPRGHRESFALGSHWVFRASESRALFFVQAPDGSDNHVITKSVVTSGDHATVVDWLLAVHDLGEPESVTVGPISADAAWVDAWGTRQHASVSRNVALRGDVKFENIRYDAENEWVVGDVLLLGGRWRLPDERLARGENYGVDDTIVPAEFDAQYRYSFTDEQRSLIAKLLRDHRHTEAWMQADRLWRQVCNNDAPSSLGGEIARIEELMADPFIPPSWVVDDVPRLERQHGYLFEGLDRRLRLQPGGDPMIYDGTPPASDAEETERKMLEVSQRLLALGTRIKAIREEIGTERFLKKLEVPGLLAKGAEEVELVYQRYLALTDEQKKRLPKNFDISMEYRKSADGGSSYFLEERCARLSRWLREKREAIATAERVLEG